jgi:hypothetical protein
MKLSKKYIPTQCYNPFKEVGHTTYSTNLRNVHPWMIEKMPSLKYECRVCDKCRKKLFQLQFKSNNLFLDQEDDSLIKIEINTYSMETVVQS